MDAVEDVKSRLSIEDVVGEYVQLKRAGRNWRGLSPWTSEKTPSLMVSPDKQIWHDFSSGKGGNIFSFVMEMEGLDFKAALELLARKAGVDLEQYRSVQGRTSYSKERLYEANEAAAHYYQVQFSKNRNPLRYVLEDRKFSKETALEWRLGYSPNSSDALMDHLKAKKFSIDEIKKAGLTNSYGSAMFRGRLMVPLADAQGRVIGFTARQLDNGNPPAGGSPKYINTPATVIYDKSRHVYGLHLAKDAIRKNNYVVLAEGNLDVIASHQAGIRQVVATAGTALTTQHLKILARFTSDIRLAFDADKAGLTATERAIPLASKVGASLSVITIPSGKDPDELIRQDADKWREIIEAPKYAIDWLINMYEKKLDLKSAQGKREFSDALLPIVKQLEDKVEQDHYLNQIADRLGVGIESLKEKMSDIGGSTFQPRRRRAEPAKLSSSEKQSAEKKKIEEHLLAILLNQPDLLKNVSLIDPSMLNPTSHNIWKAINQPDFASSASWLKVAHTDAGQGAREEQPEAHKSKARTHRSSETQHSAASSVKTGGSADEQVTAMRDLEEYAKILVLEFEELYQGLEPSELGYEVQRLQARLVEQYVKTRKTHIAEELSEAEETKSGQLLAEARKLDNLLKQSMGEIVDA